MAEPVKIEILRRDDARRIDQLGELMDEAEHWIRWAVWAADHVSIAGSNGQAHGDDLARRIREALHAQS